MDLLGAQLLIRLWETLPEKGIGWLLKPWQIKRKGLAHLEVRRAEMLTLAQTEKEVDDIRSGRKDLEDFSLTLKFAPAASTRLPNKQRIEPTIDLLKILEISACRLIEDSVRKEMNVAKAIIHAEESLKDDPREPPQAKIDRLAYRWRDYAGNVSADEMQLLLGPPPCRRTQSSRFLLPSLS